MSLEKTKALQQGVLGILKYLGKCDDQEALLHEKVGEVYNRISCFCELYYGQYSHPTEIGDSEVVAMTHRDSIQHALNYILKVDSHFKVMLKRINIEGEVLRQAKLLVARIAECKLHIKQRIKTIQYEKEKM